MTASHALSQLSYGPKLSAQKVGRAVRVAIRRTVADSKRRAFSIEATVREGARKGPLPYGRVSDKSLLPQKRFCDVLILRITN